MLHSLSYPNSSKLSTLFAFPFFLPPPSLLVQTTEEGKMGLKIFLFCHNIVASLPLSIYSDLVFASCWSHHLDILYPCPCPQLTPLFRPLFFLFYFFYFYFLSPLVPNPNFVYPSLSCPTLLTAWIVVSPRPCLGRTLVLCASGQTHPEFLLVLPQA